MTNQKNVTEQIEGKTTSLGAENFKPLHLTVEITPAMYGVLKDFAEMKAMSIEDYCEDTLQYAGRGEKIHFNVQSHIVLEVEARPSIVQIKKLKQIAEQYPKELSIEEYIAHEILNGPEEDCNRIAEVGTLKPFYEKMYDKYCAAFWGEGE